MNLPKIEKNVPLSRVAASTGLVNLVRSMKIGDSFLMPKRIDITYYGAVSGFKLTCRVEKKGGPFRIWRIA